MDKRHKRLEAPGPSLAGPGAILKGERENRRDIQRPQRPAALASLPLGGPLNPDFIPRDALSELLPESLADSAKDRFLRLCAVRAQIFERLAHKVPNAVILRELRGVAERARELAEAIGRMSDDARRLAERNAFWVALVARPAVEISELGKSLVRGSVQGFSGYRESLLLATFDLAADVEGVARYAASDLKLSRQGKPSEQRARTLVSVVAEAYYEMTGRLPPRHHASWFVRFVGELGDCLGLRCGPRLVRSVLFELAPAMDAVESRPAAPQGGATPQKTASRPRAKKTPAARSSCSRGDATPRNPALKVRTVRLLSWR